MYFFITFDVDSILHSHNKFDLLKIVISLNNFLILGHLYHIFDKISKWITVFFKIFKYKRRIQILKFRFNDVQKIRILFQFLYFDVNFVFVYGKKHGRFEKFTVYLQLFRKHRMFYIANQPRNLFYHFWHRFNLASLNNPSLNSSHDIQVVINSLNNFLITYPDYQNHL